MQAIWKGSLAFGLVNIPVKAFVATESHDVSFRQVHVADGGRIQYRKVCSVCSETVTQAQIAKGYETDSGEMLVLDDADFVGLPVRTTKEIEVLEFVPAEQVDPILFERCYYLEPEPTAVKAYTLLREALKQTDRTAIVLVTMRQKTHLAALRVTEGVLSLQTMLWPDELRRPSFPVLVEQIEVRPAELAMAASLVESMACDFDPTAFRDEYRDAMMVMIGDRISGGDGILAAPDDGEAADEVLDLMAALEASVARARAGTEVKATTDHAPKAASKPDKVRKAVKSTSTGDAPTSRTRTTAAASPTTGKEPTSGTKPKGGTKPTAQPKSKAPSG